MDDGASEELMAVSPEKRGGTAAASAVHRRSNQWLLPRNTNYEEDDEDLSETEELLDEDKFEMEDSDAEMKSNASEESFKSIDSDENENEEKEEHKTSSSYRQTKDSSTKLREDDKRATPRRQLLQSLLPSGSHLGGGTVESLKRRYSVHRSCSEEYLLGFDELSGKPQSVSEDPNKQPKAESPPLSPQAKKKKLSPIEAISPPLSKVAPKRKPASRTATPSPTPPPPSPLPPPLSSAPEKTNTEKTKTEKTKTEKTKTEETKTEETKTKETKTEETNTKETKTEETKAEKTKAEKTKAEKTKAEKTRTEETKAVEIKAEEIKEDEIKADETKAEESKAGETKAGETKAGEAKAEEPDEPSVEKPQQTVANVDIEESITQHVVGPGSTIPAPKKPLSVKDEFYRKPFEYGWKRELVYRSNMESKKDKADVYFITPRGKKLRARSDIIPWLEGDLTLEHFSFAREPLGAGPELETVRNAKPTHRASVAAATLAAAAPTPTHPGKRISKLKGPKGASPPPEGWTPTRALKTNNAALLSSASSSKYIGSYSSTPPASRGTHITSSSSSSSKANKSKKPPQGIAEAGNVPATNMSPGTNHEPCTRLCAQARGQIPQLQCVKCLCLYHHECVGLNRQNCDYRTVGQSMASAKDYVCESCVPQNSVSVAATKTATVANATAAVSTMTPNASAASASETTKATPTPLPSPSAANAKKTTPSRKATASKATLVPRIHKLPQSLAVVKGKKYVVVFKPKASSKESNPETSEHLNDIENDLKQINESIRKSRKPVSASLDAGSRPNNTGTELVQKSFATNFFANVSFAYDALLCILKYLKIHERARAAAVCKLWHLAAKDTSLWQIVRMKNSRISSWAGFAAALRRGETKHLDLRKILFSSAKAASEMWADFSTYIGTVYSLESLDLCRCFAKVVERLFLSNQQLRVLNALAINDGSYSLENIDKLTQLEELRLRTCEPGSLDGDLSPLKALTKLTHLSLTSLLGLGTKSIEVLAELVSLRSLELGECGDFDETFAQVVLPKLVNLQRLRLENGSKTSCCTLEILDAVSKLPQLSQIEFVNFDVKPGFNEKLMLCTNICKLLIIPTYISQSATTNQIVLNAVQQIAKSLKVFTWGVTVELLRVTALYVDQCEESTRKEKHHFDECIPVMKPVPGAPPSDAPEEEVRKLGVNEVPQIEILPLDKVESILGDHLPTTKFTIVKVPYQSTCKQQLVE